MKRVRTSQSGFTLLEVMIVVAIVGVLAAIALPSFTGSARKAKGDSEVNAFFAELRVRQEQYMAENGRYLATGASEAATFPATPSTQGQALGALPTTWNQLKVRTPESRARCAYVVIAGTPTDVAGPMATGSFGFVVPARNWFYVLARCNLDGNAAVDSYYFTSNESGTIKKVNAGR